MKSEKEDGRNPPVLVRLPVKLLEQLDAYRGGQSRPEAIRQLMTSDEYLRDE